MHIYTSSDPIIYAPLPPSFIPTYQRSILDLSRRDADLHAVGGPAGEHIPWWYGNNHRFTGDLITTKEHDPLKSVGPIRHEDLIVAYLPHLPPAGGDGWVCVDLADDFSRGEGTVSSEAEGGVTHAHLVASQQPVACMR